MISMMKQLVKLSTVFLVLGLFLFTACEQDEPLEMDDTGETLIELRDDGTFDVELDVPSNSPRFSWRPRGRRPGFGRLNQCVDLVFPLTLDFPGGTSDQVADLDDLRTTLRDWRQNNTTGIGGRPQIAFPFDVELADGSVYTVDERSDFREIAQDCYRGRPHYKGRFQRCFELVYPVTVNYPDGNTADAADKRALSELLRTWRAENPDATVFPNLDYPLDIELKNGTVVTVNSREEIAEATEDCRMERPHYWRNRCFELAYPVNVELSDGSIVEVADQEALFDIYKEWLESYPRGEHPEIVIPFDVIIKSDGSTIAVNSIDDLEDLAEICRN